jgi:hypothetical protein
LFTGSYNILWGIIKMFWGTKFFYGDFKFKKENSGDFFPTWPAIHYNGKFKTCLWYYTCPSRERSPSIRQNLSSSLARRFVQNQTRFLGLPNGSISKNFGRFAEPLKLWSGVLTAPTYRGDRIVTALGGWLVIWPMHNFCQKKITAELD